MGATIGNRDEYLAVKALEDIRAGRAIPPAVCAELNQYPIIDVLRRKAAGDSVDALLTLAGEGKPGASALAFAILRPHATDERVRAFLRLEWSSHQDYQKRFSLIWLLLDDADLENSMRGRIKEFVRENLPRFLVDVRSFFASPAEMVPAYRGRLADPGFPQSKKWIYLVAACGTDDISAARELLDEYISNEDPEMRETAMGMREFLQARGWIPA